MRYSSLAAPYVAIVTLAGALWFETNPPVIAHTFGILARIEKAQFMDINIYLREVALVNIPQNILHYFISRFFNLPIVAQWCHIHLGPLLQFKHKWPSYLSTYSCSIVNLFNSYDQLYHINMLVVITTRVIKRFAWHFPIQEGPLTTYQWYYYATE